MKSTSLLERALAAGAGHRRPEQDFDVRAHLRKLRPRLDLLPLQDRLLVEVIATGQQSLREFARVAGADPGNLSRRFRSLWRRLHHPVLDIVLAERFATILAPEVRQLAVEHYLLGVSVCALCDKHRIPKTQVLHLLSYVEGFLARESR